MKKILAALLISLFLFSCSGTSEDNDPIKDPDIVDVTDPINGNDDEMIYLFFKIEIDGITYEYGYETPKEPVIVNSPVGWHPDRMGFDDDHFYLTTEETCGKIKPHCLNGGTEFDEFVSNIGAVPARFFYMSFTNPETGGALRPTINSENNTVFTITFRDKEKRVAGGSFTGKDDISGKTFKGTFLTVCGIE